MTRTLAASAAAAALLVSAAAQAGGAHTTRIEHTNVYGATVSIEEGVRVFRPLPSDRHVIVNPGGETSLDLEINEPGIAHERTIRR